MNNVKVTIGGQDYTRQVSLPVTLQGTLNDTLDSAQLLVPNLTRQEAFAPMTEATLEISGSKTVYYVASDQVQEVRGADRYSHTLTLVEYTKAAERVLMEAKAFTQPLVRDYADGVSNASVHYYEDVTGIAGEIDGTYLGSDYITAFQSPVHPPVTAHAMPSIAELLAPGKFAGYGVSADADFWLITVTDSVGAEIYRSDSSVETVRPNISLTEIGVYRFCYIFRLNQKYCAALWWVASCEEPVTCAPYTLRSVTDRLLAVCLPRRVGDVQKYRLVTTADQNERFGQTAPEFRFSNSRTLWENLREVGKVAHAIPRLVKAAGYVEVRFDDLGGSSVADFSKGRRVAGSSAWDVSACSIGLETMAANLISADSPAQGTIAEPYGQGWKSLRTTSETARIQEGSSYIETTFPIETGVHLFVYFQHRDTAYQGDLTPYLFEHDDYELLQSRSGAYPTSKSYALYYTRGSKNIEGLWYKPDDAISSVEMAFRNYAITNIVALATGCEVTIFKQITYPDLCFRVEYVPTVSARIHAYKPDCADSAAGLLSYAQSANKLSAPTMGDGLRGQLAMLPAETRSEVWLFRDFADIPTPGQVADDTLYVSQVTERIYPTYCEAQIEFSERYNEQGAYVELPTRFRQYEIPDAEERYTVLDEYCYISDTYEADDNDTICGNLLKSMVADALDDVSGKIAQKITLAQISTATDGGVTLAQDILLPVMSLAVGNALYFGFRMLDNYAAGNQSIAGGDQYRMNQAVRYGDTYWSRADRLSFSLYSGATASGVIASAHAFPRYDSDAVILSSAAASTGSKPVIWYKDSADAGNVSYQLHFMTRDGYIIGAGLAAYCSAVRGQDADEIPELYFYDCKIHPLNGTTDTESAIGKGTAVSAVAVTDSDGNAVGWKIVCTALEVPDGVKSWAIIRGGRFLLGKNDSIAPTDIHLNFKRRIPE